MCHSFCISVLHLRIEFVADFFDGDGDRHGDDRDHHADRRHVIESVRRGVARIRIDLHIHPIAERVGAPFSAREQEHVAARRKNTGKQEYEFEDERGPDDGQDDGNDFANPADAVELGGFEHGIGYARERAAPNDQIAGERQPQQIRPHRVVGKARRREQLGRVIEIENILHAFGDKAVHPHHFRKHRTDHDARNDHGQAEQHAESLCSPYFFIQKIGNDDAPRKNDEVDRERDECVFENQSEIGRTAAQIIEKPGKVADRPDRGAVLRLLKRHDERIQIDVNIKHQKIDERQDNKAGYENDFADILFLFVRGCEQPRFGFFHPYAS